MKPNSQGDEIQPKETGPFVLRTLFADVPLSADGTDDDVKINCVEYLGKCAATPIPYIYIYIYTHTHIHTYTYTHTHTHTLIHGHICNTYLQTYIIIIYINRTAGYIYILI